MSSQGHKCNGVSPLAYIRGNSPSIFAISQPKPGMYVTCWCESSTRHTGDGCVIYDEKTLTYNQQGPAQEASLPYQSDLQEADCCRW